MIFLGGCRDLSRSDSVEGLTRADQSRLVMCIMSRAERRRIESSARHFFSSAQVALSRSRSRTLASSPLAEAAEARRSLVRCLSLSPPWVKNPPHAPTFQEHTRAHRGEGPGPQPAMRRQTWSTSPKQHTNSVPSVATPLRLSVDSNDRRRCLAPLFTAPQFDTGLMFMLSSVHFIAPSTWETTIALSNREIASGWRPPSFHSFLEVHTAP